MHVKEGLKFLHNILTPYEFEVTILADRGFKSIDLFKFIDETLKWKYCIRCTKDMRISIAGKRKIKKLDDITSRKGFTKYF
ncbi:MAG: transposase [Clostridium celatum]|nr:transposase [Clostridium celatum]